MILTLTQLEIPCRPVTRNVWVSTAPMVCYVNGRRIEQADPFYCDKYSRPIILAPFMPRERKVPKENTPAWWHDYFVRYRNIIGLSLVDCHNLFLQAMHICGVHPCLARIKWLGVLVGNWMMAGPGDGTPPRNIRRAIELDRNTQKG